MASRLKFALILSLVALGFCGVSSVEASAYRAFSLNEARKMVKSSEAQTLGGITRPVGCVYDEVDRDVVLIGVADGNLPELSVDELAVALRAVLKHGQPPLVSIDPAPKAAKSDDQVVRFAGKLENTRFGKDLLDADVVLKKLGLGKLNAEVWGVKSYFDLSADEWRRTGNEDPVMSRFWFLTDPEGSAVATRSGIGLVKRLKIKVQTETASSSATVTNASSPVDGIGKTFADTLTASLGDVMLAMPELRRLDQLYRLVGVASVMKRWRDKFQLAPEDIGLTYWLNDAPVEKVPTPPSFGLLASIAPGAPGKGSMTISGGVELRALAADVKDGSLSALRELVVKSRPSKGTMVWDLPITDELDEIVDIEQSSGFGSKSSSKSAGMNLSRHFVPLGKSYQDGRTESAGSPPFKPRPEHFEWAVAKATGNPGQNMGFKEAVDALGTARGQRNPTENRVGGVMLRGAATVLGTGQDDAHPAKLFSLIVPGDGSSVSREARRRFVTTLWSVYYSKEDPGISIDPIAWGAEKQLVRYIGRVVNNDLGRVMREADYLMKKWAVGTEQPDIPGFRDVDTISGRKGMTYADAFRRFWFVPEDMTFKASNGLFLFDQGRVVLKTELMLKGKQTRAVAGDQEFARFFTKNYDAIAAKYPIYNELFEYAKLVSIAKYLKQQGLPLHWYLMAHLDDVITEDSIGVVDSLSKGSKFLKDVRIEGGVEMNGRYVLEENTAAAIQRTMSRFGQPQSDRQGNAKSPSGTAARMADQTVSVEKQVFSIMPTESAVSGTDFRGIRYQTDVAIRQGTEPGLELVRYFRPPVKGVYSQGEFGNGWHLLRPYRVVPVGKPEVPFLNVLIPAKIAIRNLVTGQDEILTFDDKKYSLAGYRPADITESRIVGLFWTATGGMRLVDKLGNEFWFNEGLILSEMHFSDEFVVQFKYGYEEARQDAFGQVPYRMEREGIGTAPDMVSYGPKGEKLPLPDQLRVTDVLSGTSKVYKFGENEMGLIGYKFDAPNPLDREFIALRGDGAHVLMDTNGNEVWFTRNHEFLKWRPRLVKAVIQGAYHLNKHIKDIEFIDHHTAQLDYEFADGSFRVAEAMVLKKGFSTAIHRIAYRYADGSMLASAVKR